MTSASTEGSLRSALLALLLFGSAGTLAELLLIGHTEDAWQWLPLALLVLVLGSGTALAVRATPATRATRAAFRGLMVVCALSGLLGQWQHYSGNAEFEREIYPDRAGLELFRESMSGATPVLAPGMMTVIGLLGLLCVWRPEEPDRR